MHLLLFFWFPAVAAQYVTYPQYLKDHSDMKLDESAIKTCWTIDGTLKEADPGHPDRGHLCSGTLNIWSANDKSARELCEATFAYRIHSAQPVNSGAQPSTTCTFHINLFCQPGWYQINNRCYNLNENQITYNDAKRHCESYESTSMQNAKVAEYYSPFLSEEFKHMSLDSVWVTVPDFSQYFENAQNDIGVLVIGATWNYEVKAGSLIMDDLTSKHHALCEYTPKITSAEAYYLAKMYSIVYPMHVHPDGITFTTAGYSTVGQSGNSFDKANMIQSCMNVAKVVSLESFPQLAISEEMSQIYQFLNDHRYYLSGATRQGDCKNGYYDDRTPVFSVTSDHCQAHSLSVSRGGRHPSMAAMRAPVLCGLDVFIFNDGTCQDVSGYHLEQYKRKSSGNNMCHYIPNGYHAILHDAAKEKCQNDLKGELTGFEENEEVDQIINYLGSVGMHDHYVLGGKVPCEGGLCTRANGEELVAMWNPTVSNNNEFLETFKHDHYPWQADGNLHISLRSDVREFHTHDKHWTQSYICGLYGIKVAIKKPRGGAV